MPRSTEKLNTIPVLWGLITGLVTGSMILAGVLVSYKFNKTVHPGAISTIIKETDPQDLNRTLELDIYPMTDIHPISRYIYGSNLTAKTEFEMDVVKFAKDMGITMFRFPGTQSEGYHWRTGKMDFEPRYDNAPLAKLDNVIKFSQLTGAKLQLQANIESGTPQEAADWVREMNIVRKEHVEYWEIGNETYGDWERLYLPGEEYAKLVVEYSKAMKAVDPTIKIGANLGGPNFPNFDEAVIRDAAEAMDFVSYHWYPNHINATHAYEGRNHPLPEEIMANSLNVYHMKKRIDDMVAKYAPHRLGKIATTFLEWEGSWDGAATDLNYEYQGIMWSLANAIFYADAIGQFAVHQIPVALNYDYQEVMFGLIRGWDKDAGWGGSRWDGVTIRPKAYAIKLYSDHFGDILVKSELKGSPEYFKKRDWRADSYEGSVPYVSAYVSRFSNEGKIAIALINKHSDKDFAIKLNIHDLVPSPQGAAWVLNGPSLESQNDGAPGTVGISEFVVEGVAPVFHVKLPAHSVMMMQIPLTSSDAMPTAPLEKIKDEE